MRARGRGVLAVGSALATLLAVGTACTGGSPGGATTSASTPAPTTSPGAPTAAPLRDPTVDLVVWCDPDTRGVLEPFVAQFGREQGITVAVQASTDAVRDFTQATRAGAGPDVLLASHDALGDLAQAGLVAPVPVAADVLSALTKPSVRAVTYAGRGYGVPYATSSIGLLRNTRLAPGVPGTQDDLLAEGRRLVAAGQAARPLVQGVGAGGDPAGTYAALTAFGGGVFGDKDSGEVDPGVIRVDNDGSVNALTYLGRLGADGILSTTVDRDAASALFATGTVPYLVAGPEAMDPARAAGVPVGVSPLPTLAGTVPAPVLDVRMVYVSARAKNDAFAQELAITYATRPDVQAALSGVGHRLPALQSALDQVIASDATARAWADASRSAVPAANLPGLLEVWAALGRAEAAVVGHQASPAEALAAARTEIATAVEPTR